MQSLVSVWWFVGMESRYEEERREIRGEGQILIEGFQCGVLGEETRWVK
jgi:hypothetical protein